VARSLLIRGMLAGILAAILAVLFARGFAEPQIDLAIGFEAAHEAASHAMAEPEIVSRATQKGIGLMTAVGLYGAAVGGIFALVFAFAYGRLAPFGPRVLALVLAGAAFVAVVIVPALKYPPNPPAVGLHDTVGLRTITYFALVAASLASMVISIRMGKQSAARIGAFNGMLFGAASYGVLVIIALVLLPSINEVPSDFPAVLLWRFRLASIGTQLLLWTTIGIAFGAMADRVLRRAESATR
jgi:predicted cobalt transporter CbtA